MTGMWMWMIGDIDIDQRRWGHTFNAVVLALLALSLVHCRHGRVRLQAIGVVSGLALSGGSRGPGTRLTCIFAIAMITVPGIGRGGGRRWWALRAVTLAESAARTAGT